MDRRVSGALDTAHLGGGRAGRSARSLTRCRRCGSCRPPGRDCGWWAGSSAPRDSAAVDSTSPASPEPDGGGWAVSRYRSAPTRRAPGRSRRQQTACRCRGRQAREMATSGLSFVPTRERHGQSNSSSQAGDRGGPNRRYLDRISDSRSWSGTGSHACPVAGTWSSSPCSGAAPAPTRRQRRPGPETRTVPAPAPARSPSRTGTESDPKPEPPPARPCRLRDDRVVAEVPARRSRSRWTGDASSPVAARSSSAGDCRQLREGTEVVAEGTQGGGGCVRANFVKNDHGQQWRRRRRQQRRRRQ